MAIRTRWFGDYQYNFYSAHRTKEAAEKVVKKLRREGHAARSSASIAHYEVWYRDSDMRKK